MGDRGWRMAAAAAVIGAVLVMGSAEAPAAAGAAGEAEFDRYRIAVRLNTETHNLEGTQEVTITNRSDEPWTELHFLLLANLGEKPNPYIAPVHRDRGYGNGWEPSYTNVAEVTDDAGQALAFRYVPAPPTMQTYSLDRAGLAVTLPQPLPPGGSATVRMRFETHFPDAYFGDQSRAKGIYTWRFGWNPILVPPEQVDSARFELPAAFYDVELTLPERFVVASGADEQIERVGNGGEKVVELRSPEPRRSVALSMGPAFRTVTVHAASGIPVVVYHLPGYEHQANVLASLAAQALDHHAAHFGPYRYRRLVVAQNPNPGAGMAADGIVLLTDNVFMAVNLWAPGFLDRLLLWFVGHEVAHQWFGIGIGADFDEDNWISEAFSSYAAYRLFEERYGAQGPNLFDREHPDVLVAALREAFGDPNLREWMSEAAYLAAVKDRMDEPVVLPLRKSRYFNTLSTRVYQKGYLVVRAMEGLVGRERMDAFLTKASARWGHRIVRTAEFLALAKELTGQDVAGWLDPWLHGDGVLDLAVGRFNARREGDRWTAEVEVRTLGSAALPAVVRLRLQDGTTRDVMWSPGEPERAIRVETEARPVAVEIDPDAMLPDINRLNNRHPAPVELGSSLPFTTREYRVAAGPWIQARTDEGAQDAGAEASMSWIAGGFLAGRWRNDHQWRVAAGALFDGSTGERTPAASASATFSLSRGAALQASVDLERYRLSGDLTYAAAVWLPRMVGAAAPYWWPQVPYGLGVGVRPYTAGDGTDPVTGAYVRLMGAWYDELASARQLGGELRLVYPDLAVGGTGIGTALRASLSQMGRLHPKVFTVLQAQGGAGWGPLPSEERPKTALVSWPAEEARWAGGGRLGLAFPLATRLDVALYNLAVVEGVEGQVFAEVGGFEAWNGTGGNAWRAGVGAELGFNLMLPLVSGLSLRLGAAIPVWASDSAVQPLEKPVRVYVTAGASLYQ